MAHEITATDNVVLAKRSAWHGLGTVVEEAPTVAGAIQLAGLDWEVEAWPMSATDGDRKFAVGTHVLNVRSDTKAPLGVVGEGYVPLQNTELGGFAEQLMGVGVRIESAGSLRGGKRVWLLCRTEEVVEFGRNGDDRVVPYILLANGHDGALAFTVQPTTVRVVCSNTFHMAIGRSRNEASAGRALRVRHTSGMSWRVDDARRVLEAHGVVVKSWREQAQQLAARPMSKREIGDYFKSVYAGAFAVPTSERGEQRRTNVLERWMANTDRPSNTIDGIGGTAWSAFNVVTEYVDHAQGSENQTRDDRHYRGWFGSGVKVKQTAWDSALATLG
jgi:phage/plasmid-like protein (TIGR03299 family)